jgi:hypothetical protein
VSSAKAIPGPAERSSTYTAALKRSAWCPIPASDGHRSPTISLSVYSLLHRVNANPEGWFEPWMFT